MAKPQIKLYVDAVSPFAYLAFYALRNWPIFEQCEISYVPIFLGGLMKSCNNTPPINIKNKDKWVDVERLRWARLFRIPMTETMPEGFPPLTLTVQRALTALTLEQPEKLADVLAAVYHDLWVEQQAVQKPEVAVKSFSKGLGCSEDEAKAFFDKGSTPEAKKLLVENTESAFAAGAFGLPWFEVTNSKGMKEGFWGFDHLGQVIDFLGLARPTKDGFQAML